MVDLKLRVTTGEAAEIIHVHESSIKRWCDAGDLEHELTPGGHRRVMLDSLLNYAEAAGLECELLRFGEDAEIIYQSVERARSERFGPSVALMYGDLRDGRTDRIGPYLSLLVKEGIPLERVLDEVVAPILHKVGRGWNGGSLGVGDEHRISGLVTDALYELRHSVGPAARGTAVIGCMEGNRHDIGANMARMALESAGWNVVYLGADVPLHELVLQQRSSGSTLIGVAMAPPQVASDARRTLHVLTGLYREDAPYRLALGGSPVRQLEGSDLEGLPFADCRTFDRLDAFTKWV